MMRLSIPSVLIAFVMICVGVEGILLLGDYGLLPPPRLRATVYEYAGFWPGLLLDWRPNYLAQPYTMFVTYAFLHGGPIHLIVNMITLISLGRTVCDRVGSWGFVAVYFGAVLGGALGFGLLASSLQPMVGASGGLFGLIGGLLAWNYIDRFTHAQKLWPVARSILFLVVLNMVLWWAMDGLLAWQTHLGGFLAGWIMALLVNPSAQEI